MSLKTHSPVLQMFVFLKMTPVMLQVSRLYLKRLCVRDRCTLVPVQLWYLHVGSTECCLDWNARGFGAPLPALIPFLLLPGIGWARGSRDRWRNYLNGFLGLDVFGMQQIFSVARLWCSPGGYTGRIYHQGIWEMLGCCGCLEFLQHSWRIGVLGCDGF